jgi:hypothetical protein
VVVLQRLRINIIEHELSVEFQSGLLLEASKLLGQSLHPTGLVIFQLDNVSVGYRNPAGSGLLVLLIDVALNAIEFIMVLGFEVNQIVDIDDRVMVCVAMVVKVDALFFKLVPRVIANEANISEVFIPIVMRVSQLCKRVNNNTENDIQRYNVDQRKVRQVKKDFPFKKWVTVIQRVH